MGIKQALTAPQGKAELVGLFTAMALCRNASAGLTALAVASCSSETPDDAAALEDSMMLKLSALESETRKQERHLRELREELSALAVGVGSATDLANEAYAALPQQRIVTLRPDSEKYETLTWDLGRMTLALIGVEKHARGTWITLQVGNPTYARLYRVKAKLAYGEVDRPGQPVGETVKAPRALLTSYVWPGMWSVTRLVLDGVPADKLGYVSIGDVEVEGVSLQRKWLKQ